MNRIFLLLFVCLVSTLTAQPHQNVDFKTVKGTLSFFPINKTVKGNLTYSFNALKNTDTVFLDARNMKVELLTDSPLKPRLQVTKNKIYFIHPFKAGTTYTVSIAYEVQKPKKALYFVNSGEEQSPQIWSQGQGQENSHWLPSLDNANDKIKFNLTYAVPKGFQAIGNGKLVQQKTKKNRVLWQYQMDHPISSYLVAVAIGHYKKKELTATTGTPIELYYELPYKEDIEPTYRYSKRIFDFLEKTIGVDYPFENYKMVPVRNFMYAGMENATTTLFSERFMTDSTGFIDRNFINVNAHELAHQWFGDAVTQESEKDHWLQEGFASYYALLTEKEIFGEDYFYFKLYESAEKLKEQSDKGKGESLLNPKASSLTFYEKGAWALHILRTRLGAQTFKKGIQSYLTTYAYQNANVKDFMHCMEEVSGSDLSGFVKNWLKQSAFQDQEALETLKKSDFITSYMEIVSLRSKQIQDKYEELNKALDFPVNPYIGQEVVYQLAEEKASDKRRQLLEKAFKTNNILVRQALASALSEIAKGLQKPYEGLLQDDSYLTQEKALFNLWQNFPQKAGIYLEELKNTQGFYDKNIRTLWLTLSLVTPNYNPDKKDDYYQELSHYTAPQFDYSIRQNAFGFLYQINRFSEESYKNLMQATLHPAWQFKKFSRELLQELLKEDRHREALTQLADKLNPKEQQVLQKQLQ